MLFYIKIGFRFESTLIMKPVKNNAVKNTPTKSARRNWQPLATVSHVKITPAMTVGNWVKMANDLHKKAQLLLP